MNTVAHFNIVILAFLVVTCCNALRDIEKDELKRDLVIGKTVSVTMTSKEYGEAKPGSKQIVIGNVTSGKVVNIQIYDEGNINTEDKRDLEDLKQMPKRISMHSVVAQNFNHHVIGAAENHASRPALFFIGDQKAVKINDTIIIASNSTANVTNNLFNVGNRTAGNITQTVIYLADNSSTNSTPAIKKNSKKNHDGHSDSSELYPHNCW